uniref:Transmembrane protein 104 n=1 Tax=Phallusia mammillata TaxID=59560 RepID=A0A6F9DVX9_9ASCI|nr:transmembrane protein 104 [Phallusia mammillata]
MYSPTVGTIYVFNLIVGTGALTLPKAMGAAGWLISTVLLCFLGFVSYITTTFVVETLSVANACIRQKKTVDLDEDDTDASSDVTNAAASNINENVRNRPNSTSESTRLLDESNNLTSYLTSNQSSLKNSAFEITQPVEMGEMADMFFNKVGRTLFYLCIAIYLYGDLAIYAAAVPKSLRDIVCQNMSCASTNHTVPKDSDICWGSTITRMDVYRIFLAIFTVVLGPFTYFDIQKTKYLQIFTTVCRWVAFIMMIVLAIVHMANKGSSGKPPLADLTGVPNLFGVSVYSFMCQHSLPSLVTPIRNKQHLSKILAADYLLILLFYSLLGFTAIFCFPGEMLKDIYTLNFQDSCYVTDVSFLRYFLGLFPVFTLSTNFPIIAVTLRNNLKALFKPTQSFLINRLLFPTMAILPPIIIAFITNDLTTLVGVTGSYAGAGVQYVIPALLVYYARKEVSFSGFKTSPDRNQHRSPFSRKSWIFLVLAWSVICLVFVTTNHVLSWTTHKNGTHSG